MFPLQRRPSTLWRCILCGRAMGKHGAGSRGAAAQLSSLSARHRAGCRDPSCRLHSPRSSPAQPSHLQTHPGDTESQNVRGWKDPLWATQPNPLPKQGHPEQGAQHRGQAGLEYLQRRRLHSPSGQPGPGLRHPQRQEVLPRVQLELPLLQFVPHTLTHRCDAGPAPGISPLARDEGRRASPLLSLLAEHFPSRTSSFFAIKRKGRVENCFPFSGPSAKHHWQLPASPNNVIDLPQQRD